MPLPVDISTTPQSAEARQKAGSEGRLGQTERSRRKPGYFVDTSPSGSGNPPKPSGSPPNGSIATGYYPNKTAGFRTWQWARANGEWYGVNAAA